MALQKKVSRKRKELQRTPNLTPSKKLRKLTEGRFVHSNIKKVLFKGLVLEEECKSAKNAVKSDLKAKNVYSRLLSGKVIKKYRLLRECKGILFPRVSVKGRKWIGDNASILKVNFKGNSCDIRKKEAVVNYFLSEDASHATPGKKDFVIVNKEKLPKRYLNGPMNTLYPRFLRQCGLVVSYSTFCNNKPENVVYPKFSGRDTCLCEKCDNFKFVMNSLKIAKVIDVSNKDVLFSALCCDSQKPECLLRSCNKCKSRQLDFKVADGRAQISYYQWVNKKVPHRSDPQKTMSITKKELKESTVSECVTIFKDMIVKMMGHVGRIIHQRQHWKLLQENISEEDLLLNIDWSEKYACQYSREVQSMHFGGSHKELSLHTGVAIRKCSQETFCTVSDCVKQGPKDIYAHLKPILKRHMNEKIKKMHFMSDGPTTQYRNKSMFYVVAKFISADYPQVECIVWNFSECGHGKSIADGVGGTVKRTADNVIAFGKDITGVNSFVDAVSPRCNKIFICEIADDELHEANCLNVPDTLKPFKGTLKVHQYHWRRSAPNEINFKYISCYECLEISAVCDHFSLGKPWVFSEENKKKRPGGGNEIVTQKKAGKKNPKAKPKDRPKPDPMPSRVPAKPKAASKPPVMTRRSQRLMK
jgi:hypothetical protein